MKISSKGQVTIPRDIREKYGLQPGTEIEFIEEHGLIYIHLPRSIEQARALVRRMSGQGDVNMTTDQILALTRGDE